MPSALAAALKDKPKVPKYPLVDITEEQKLAAEGNIENLPIMQQLASATNKFAAAEIEKQMERVLPGYRGLINKGTENIASFQRGELPSDVARILKQRSAEAGIALGTSGSQAQKFDELRNLGLASLDLTQRGLDAASRWIASAQSRAPTVDVSSMFITPQQRIQVKLQENANIFNRNWLAAKVKAIPSGGKAFAITLLDEVQELAFSAMKMYMGGGMGGGGGAGMMGGGGGGSSSPPVTDAWQGMSGLQSGDYSGGPGFGSGSASGNSGGNSGGFDWLDFENNP